MRHRSRPAACAAALLALIGFVITPPARAGTVLNLGMDVGPDGARSPAGFFGGDDDGQGVGGGWFFLGFELVRGQALEITLDTRSLLRDAIVHSAELFVDAVDIDADDDGLVSAGTGLLGRLQDNRAGSQAPTRVPVADVFGGRQLAGPGDVDNTFFSLDHLIDEMRASPAFTIRIRNADTALFGPANPFRVDGINLQFAITPLAAVPEPSTLALGLTGCTAAGLAAWRRRRASA